MLGIEGECLPYATNRVELSDEPDEYGPPRPKVTFYYGRNEKAMRQEICDASVFPTSGGAKPSQTIMALAARLAAHLARTN